MISTALVLSLILFSYFIVYENFSKQYFDFNNKVNKFKEFSKKILVIEHIQILKNNSLIVLIRNRSSLNITLEKLEIISDKSVEEIKLSIILGPNVLRLLKLKLISNSIEEIILYYAFENFQDKLILYASKA